MLINKAALTALFLTLKSEFNDALNSEGSEWTDIADMIPSTSAENVYQWVDEFPAMRKWVGEKRLKSLEAHEFTIKNDDFESTIVVKRNDLEDEQMGMYARRAMGAGVAARDWPADIVFELVNLAFTAKCYDGQYMIDTDHPVRNPATGEDESVSNKLTVALSATTQAAARASLGVARTRMRTFKDNEGRPLKLRPRILLVPPALEDVGLMLVNNDRLEDGKANPYKGTMKLKVEERLTSDTAWFVIDNSKPLKPFIFQRRKAPVFVQQTNMDSDDVFNRGEFKYGAEARGSGGYGFWQMVVGSTGAG